MTPRRRIGFPLLAKELTELANRKRTYVVRFLYAAGLFVGGLIAIYSTVGATGGDVRLGVGREIFHELVSLQFWLILIFLPPTACGALTIEKERDSLALLLLTTMPPWSILLQKYLSRLMPMVSFLLLSFPLLAVAYTYGGVSTGELVGSIIVLLLFAAQVCAVAILCSTYFRTTPESLIGTYGSLLALYLSWAMWPPSVLSYYVRHAPTFWPVVIFEAMMVSGVVSTSLLMARLFLQRRAFIPPRNALLQAFQWLDRLYTRMNHITGDVVLVNDTNSLPEDAPVAWRETAKKSLGTFRYLFRVCTVLELPILFVGAGVNISMVRTHSIMSDLLFLLWGIAAAMICVHASGVITAERSRQTLDALLTTPMTGEDILLQKMAGVKRLIFVLWVPFGTIYLFQLWFRGFHIGYFLGSIASAAVLMPLIAWIAMTVGLRIRATMKAILVSVGVVVLIGAAPYIISALTFGLIPANVVAPVDQRFWSEVIRALSPASVIATLESRGEIHNRTTELVFWLRLSPLLAYGYLGWSVRRNCLKQADERLQRVAQPTDIPPLGSATEPRWQHEDVALAVTD